MRPFRPKHLVIGKIDLQSSAARRSAGLELPFVGAHPSIRRCLLLPTKLAADHFCRGCYVVDVGAMKLWQCCHDSSKGCRRTRVTMQGPSSELKSRGLPHPLALQLP